MSRFGVSALCLLAAGVASSTPLDDFRAASRIAWGSGTGLDPAYATADMTVTIRVRFGIFWTSYNSTSVALEQALPKTSGSLGFSVDLSTIDPTFPPTIVNLTGTQLDADSVNWAISQTFSQAGGYPVSGTFAGIVVNLTVNNIVTTGNLRATFSTIPFLYNVPLQAASEVRGTYENGDVSNYIDMIPTSVSGTVGGIPANGLEIHLRQIQHIAHVPAPPSVIAGNALLNDVSIGNGLPLTYELLRAGNVLQSGTFTPSAAGAYSISTTAIPGPAELWVRGETHLAKRIPVVIGATTSTDFSLINGDVDGDNEVGPGDFSLLSAAFGNSGVQLADLDRDEEVGPSDFSILSANFGESGD